MINSGVRAKPASASANSLGRKTWGQCPPTSSIGSIPNCSRTSPRQKKLSVPASAFQDAFALGFFQKRVRKGFCCFNASTSDLRSAISPLRLSMSTLRSSRAGASASTPPLADQFLWCKNHESALFVYEEVLIHFLQVQSFVNSNTDIVPDHQSCELLSIDEHDSERVTPGAKLWAGCVNTRWSRTRPCLHSLVTSGTAFGGLTERPCQFYTYSFLRMLFSFGIASPK